MSDTKWIEPQADWMPLRQAVFKFGLIEDEDAIAIHDKPSLFPPKGDFAALQNLNKLETKSDVLDSGIVKTATAPFSRRQLTEILRETSGARRVEIDVTESTFSFGFRGSASGGRPWEILKDPVEAAGIAHPRFNDGTDMEGFVRISDEDAARFEQEWKGIRKATGLVFRQFMVCTFDRAVSTKAVVLYAQKGALSAPFERVPAHVWPLLDILDWENGVVVTPDGTVYWSVHVQPSIAAMSAPVASEVPATAAPQVPSFPTSPTIQPGYVEAASSPRTAQPSVEGASGHPASRHMREAEATTVRHVNPTSAKKFAQKYIDGESVAARRATISGLEKSARAEGIRGGRDLLRQAFRQIQNSDGIEVKAGRPGNSPC